MARFGTIANGGMVYRRRRTAAPGMPNAASTLSIASSLVALSTSSRRHRRQR